MNGLNHFLRRVYSLGFSVLILTGICPVNTGAQTAAPDRNAPISALELDIFNSFQYYIQIKQGMARSRYNQDSAIQYILHKVSESERLGYDEAVFQGYYFLGILYIFRGEYDVAFNWLRKALVHSARSIHVHLNVCRSLNNLGNIFQFRGDYREALECYFKAISLVEDKIDENPEIANPLCRTYTSTASALMYLNEYSRALYYLNKAELLAEKMKMNRNLPAIYVNKATILAKMGEDQRASTYNQMALSVLTEIPEEVRFLALQNQGDILLKHGQYQQAVTLFRDALNIKGNITPYYKIGALSSLGLSYFALEDLEKAEKFLLKAYEIAANTRIPLHRLQIHQHLARLYESTNKYKLAYEHRTAAYMLNDSLWNRDKLDAVNQMEVKYRTSEREREVAEKQLLINEQRRKLSQKNAWIVASVSGASLLGFMLFGIYQNYRQRKKLYAEQWSRMQKEKEIELLQAMMQGEENEKIRFAQDLHDGISCQLSAIRMYLDGVRSRTGSAPVFDELSHAIGMLQETADDVRRTAHNLMPDGLVRQGLEEAIRSFCSFISQGNKLQIEVQAYGDFTQLESGQALAIYRMVQELVHNIVKHAQATQAIVLLTSREGTLYLTVEDNGNGMVSTDHVGGMGLRNIKERILVMGGQMIIEAQPGNGSTIYVEWPLIERNNQNIPTATNSLLWNESPFI